MRLRTILAVALVLSIGAAMPALAERETGRARRGGEISLPENFRPAILSREGTARYFVQMRAPAVADAGVRSATAQRRAMDSALASQAAAIRQARSLGGEVVFRYGLLVNAFSVEIAPAAAAELAERPDVALVEPVAIVRRTNETSVPFIGGTKTWKRLGVRGKGITVAVVDTGIDYTHADFGGPGTVAAYTSNDPDILEPGSFPTGKVVAGYDFVGGNYDVLDDLTTNDLPVPDPDPLDVDGHGTHTAGTCCGNGVDGVVGPGVAPRAKVVAVKVWDVGNSTADVLVAGYEFAVDPDGDGSTDDAADVLSFSGGVSYGPPNSTEARAAQNVVRQGTVFVASAGNEGNQPNGGSGYILGTPAAAPGVIAVAASIDQFVAQRLTVDSPSGVVLPDGGPIVWQDWSAAFTTDLTAEVVDAREFDPPADPGGVPTATDRILCDATPSGTPFAGSLVLVFKGPFSAGDCFVEDKVINAQQAGAIGVIIWDGFGGLPGVIGTGGNEGQVTIPAVDLSGNDSEALAAAISPNAPAAYNEVAVSVTVTASAEVIPGYEDRMVDFTSEGPARISNALKPDISAPGSDITSAAVGSGDGAATFSGTSMAAPHVSGSAALLLQLHPNWSVSQIKAVLMNQATQALANLDGSGPVPATVIGSGRVQVFRSAMAESLATPGSVSFGLRGVSDYTTILKRIRVRNMDTQPHTYRVSGDVRYTDFSRGFASVKVAVEPETLVDVGRFTLAPGRSRTVWLELTLDPDRVPKWQQVYGWYYFNPNVDGNIDILQTGGRRDRLHVPWHVSALAASDTGVRRSSLDLTGGSAQLGISEAGFGAPYADMYLLGATSPEDTGGEEDVAAIGARSFAGAQIDGVAEGVPAGTDPLAGLTWLEFLTFDNEPTEPVEFAYAAHGTHNTTETLEVDVLIDLGADGNFKDNALGGDVLLVKIPGTGVVCQFDLPSDFSACDATYFPDYTNYNGDVFGIPADAQTLGLTDVKSDLSYQVTACTGEFAGDVPTLGCETVGDLDPMTGTYTPYLDVTAPALVIDPLVVDGFWNGGSGPVQVSTGSAAPGDDPGILALFPNNSPGDQWAVVSTST